MSSLRVMMKALLLLVSLLVVAFGSADVAQVQEKPAPASLLAMDIEWVYQGNKFGFTGFFCEILGMSSGFKAMFPEMRISKSHYDESMHEGPLGAKADLKRTRVR